MDLILKVVGIDVSKATLAVCYAAETQFQHAEVSNSKAGFEQQPCQLDDTVLVECRQLEQVSEQLIRQKTMMLNSLEALQRHPVVSAQAEQHLCQALGQLEEQIQVLETELVGLLEQHYAREMPLLCSIPDIGRKTAAMLLLFAKGFTQVETYRQLTAKAGLYPREYSSGTSVWGKSRITCVGGGLIRNKLFMCSFTVKKTNAACKVLYDRLVAKGKNGKNGKLALIAVCNKLLKQACAIVKSGIPYQTDFTRIAA